MIELPRVYPQKPTERVRRIGYYLHVIHALAAKLQAFRFCKFRDELFPDDNYRLLWQLVDQQLPSRDACKWMVVGQVRILIPMLSSVSEINQTLHLIENAKQSLRDEKIAFNEQVPVGGMIEIPAAALCLDVFMRKLDFLSIGTNDLIQYTLAIDRVDDAVAHLYDPLHPAVLWLVSRIIHSANRVKIPVALCGEMAGDIQFTRLLLGLGLQQFSMYPAQILTVKSQVLKSHLPDIKPIANRILKTEHPEKIYALLAKLNH